MKHNSENNSFDNNLQDADALGVTDENSATKSGSFRYAKNVANPNNSAPFKYSGLKAENTGKVTGKHQAVTGKHQAVTGKHQAVTGKHQAASSIVAEQHTFIPADNLVSDSAENSHYAEQDQNASAPKKKKGKKVLLIVLIVILALILGACVFLFIDDYNKTQKLPANTTLDSAIDVSNMSKDQLSKTIDEHFANDQLPVFSLSLVQSDGYVINYNEIGSSSKDKTIKAAFDVYGDNVFSRIFNRLVNNFKNAQSSYDVYSKVEIDDNKLNEKVAAIAADYNAEPQSAHYEYDEDSNGLIKYENQLGVALDQEDTKSAIKNNADVKDMVTTIYPNVVTAPGDYENDFNQAIYVDTVNCHLWFYTGNEVTFDAPCTPGMGGSYATPTGDFTVSNKEKNPSWYNPHSGWSSGMAETIGPGPSNPLGLAAIALSCGGGIFIHGTTSLGALGTRASHGCIRLANAKVLELYPMVEVGAPVFVR
ncbi:MAG: L,D-transpeptidase/peptidoglycan binding protein [Coriobacteriales bacterium]|nr:L,D-transpeptidase/peptidoglycan binding protein [Coriobacteriales bacterium]